MKLFSLIILFSIELLPLQKVNAQPSSGDFLLGGNINAYYNTEFSFEGEKKFKTKNFLTIFNPQIGFFITDRIAIGLSTDIMYRENKRLQIISDTILDDVELEVNKSAFFTLSSGGFISYYYPFTKNIFLVNKLNLQTGYASYGINFSSFVGSTDTVFQKYYYSLLTLQTSLQYYFKPYLSLTAEVNTLDFSYSKRASNLSFMRKTFTIGINYLIQSNDE